MAAINQKKPQITRDQIIDEALALIKQTSLAGLTMRSLADRLGIRAASLYWHFPNKAALASAMSERLFLRGVEAAEQTDDWRAWMRSVGLAVWDNLIDYPDSALIITTSDLSDDEFAHTVRAVRQRLARLDLAPDEAFALHAAVQALMTGWITFAHSPYASKLASVVDLRANAARALDAMILGWRH